MIIQLTKEDSSVLKGIALLMLLWHHLFYTGVQFYDDVHLWGDHYLVNTIGITCKLCVSLFVFLSGYGLTVQANMRKKEITYCSFLRHRVFKLFPTYWLIWLLFVPYGVFCLGKTPDVVYGSHPYLNLFLDITGILNVFGKIGYNGSWWFMSCIIVLYLIFPLLYRALKNNLLYVIGIGVILSTAVPFMDCVKWYSMVFVIGMLMANEKMVGDRLRLPGAKILLTVLILMLWLRIRAVNILTFDWFITVIIVLLYTKTSMNVKLKAVLDFLGKHSMNIFLFHNFIYLSYCHSFVYASRNPLLIFLSLLLVCIPVSIGINYIKKIIRI